MRSVPLPACLVLAKEFVDRVERIEHNLSLLDCGVREKEKKVSDERELMEAYQTLSRIEDAKRTTAAHDAARKPDWLDLEAHEPVRQRSEWTDGV